MVAARKNPKTFDGHETLCGFTKKDLQEHFKYDRKNGKLLWIKLRRYGASIGDIAGHLGKKGGYLYVYFKGEKLLVHRIIFFLIKGFIPLQIDHKDLNKTNNKIRNLRLADNTKNNHNRKRQKNSSSRYKCVQRRVFNSGTLKWRAVISIKRKHIHLGYFWTQKEAAKAYNKAAKKMFGKYARLNDV